MPSETQNLIQDLSKSQIDAFFQDNTDVTRAQCDEWATQAVGRPVCASPVQGATSYTVQTIDSAAGVVVQFRPVEYALNIEFNRAIQTAYGPRFVPSLQESGTLGGLHAYTMNDVGGVCAYLARDQLRAHRGRLLRNTLEDFAQFFAAPWHNTSSSMPTRARLDLYASYKADLKKLRQGLPKRFHQMLDHLLQALPNLFADDWPMVPNHPDLLENNIHVSPETGRITGICDWKDAALSPFGMSLVGLESLLGERTTTGWRWARRSLEFRCGFWRAFAVAMRCDRIPERIYVARLVGVFLTSGLEWVDVENREPVAEGSSGMSFLEAVTLGGEATWGGEA